MKSPRSKKTRFASQAKDVARSQKPSSSKEASAKVLYQKMGDRWFAFSLVNNELYVGSISQEEIDQSALPHSNTESTRDQRSNHWEDTTTSVGKPASPSSASYEMVEPFEADPNFEKEPGKLDRSP